MSSERHPLDRVSLIAGLIFVIVAVLGLGDVLTELDPSLIGWLLPAALVLLGVGVLLQAARDHGDRHDAGDDR